MEIHYIPRQQIAYFSDLDCKLAYNQDVLTPFISNPFSIEASSNQLEIKASNYANKIRNNLVNVLRKQYDEKIMDIETQLNLLADENTFTVTTGHQLNLLTGPLYFLYKIAHTIKLSQELKLKYPTKNFIPIYWMASEDHDFDEINHFNLFGNKIEWNTEQTGPVGLFNLDSWDSWRNELRNIFPNDLHQVDAILDVYKGSDLADATRNLVHFLFHKYGLVIIDANHPELKKLFRKTMAKEVMTSFSKGIIDETNKKLSEKNIKTQINPRPINLFFMEKGRRERLIPENGNITIPNVGVFSPIEIIDLIDSRPELFSPNVALRPLYQETILPNIAYVGGAGELSYWIQLKNVFESVDVPFPLLSLRNSFHIMEINHEEKLNKLKLSYPELSNDLDTIKKQFVLNNSTNTLDFSDLNPLLENLESSLISKASEIDSTLIPFVGSEMARIQKTIESLKGRLLKTEKNKFEQELNQIENLKNKLFPNNGLQERNTNFLPYFLKYGDDFIANLIKASDPFGNDFQLINLDKD